MISKREEAKLFAELKRNKSVIIKQLEYS